MNATERIELQTFPILYKPDETNFNTNGLGMLSHTISAHTTEVRNGPLTLELTYPMSGLHYSEIKKNSLIKARYNPKDELHLFRVNEIEKDDKEGTILIYASSILDDLNGTFIKSCSVANVDTNTALNELKNALVTPTRFTFFSNMKTTSSSSWTNTSLLGAISGESGSILDKWGGEIKRENHRLIIYDRRGRSHPITIRPVKNLVGAKMKESFIGKYTQIMPYFTYKVPVMEEGEQAVGANEDGDITVYGDIVKSPKDLLYPVSARRLKGVDFSENSKIKETLERMNKEFEDWKKSIQDSRRDQEGEFKFTPAEINQGKTKISKIQLSAFETMMSEARRYFIYLNPGIDEPSIEYNIDFLQVSDTVGYEQFKGIETVLLCDTVKVISSMIDTPISLKVTELKYDVLTGHTTSLVLSNGRSKTLAEGLKQGYVDLREENKKLSDKIKEQNKDIKNFVQTSANGKNSIYYGPDEPEGNFSKGDTWFKELEEGEVEQWTWTGVEWKRVMHAGFGKEVEAEIDKLRDDIDKAISESEANRKKEYDGLKDLLDQNRQTSASELDDFRRVTDRLTAAQSTMSNNINDLISKADEAEREIRKVSDREETTRDKIIEAYNKIDELKKTDDVVKTTVEKTTRDIQDINNKIVGVEDKYSKITVGSRNLLKGAATFEGNWTNAGSWTKGEEFHGLSSVYGTPSWRGIYQNINVKSGLTYTYSVWVKSPERIQPRIFITTPTPTNANAALEGHSSQYFKYHPELEPNQWTRVSHTFKVTKDGLIQPRVEKRETTGTLYVAGPQLEIGNVMSDFHYNEDDVSSEEARYREGVEGKVSEIRNTTQTLDGNIRSANTKIEQNSTSITQQSSKITTLESGFREQNATIQQQANSIKLKADQRTVDELNTTLENASAQIEINKNAIKSKVDSSVVDSYNNRVTQLSTLVQQQAGEIESKASKTLLDEANRKITTAETSIRQNADEIKKRLTATQLEPILNDKGYATVTSLSNMETSLSDRFTRDITTVNTRISGLYTGTRNLILDSRNMNSNEWVVKGENRADHDKYNNFKIRRVNKASTVTNYAEGLRYDIKHYKFDGSIQREYILSFWAKSPDRDTIVCHFWSTTDTNNFPNKTMKIETSTGYTGNSADGYAEIQMPIDEVNRNTWKRYWVKYTIHPEYKGYLNVVVGRQHKKHNSSNTFKYIAGIALYEGHLAIDPSDAPEDLYTNVESVTSTKFNQTNESINLLAETTTTMQTTINNQKSSITALSDSIKQKVSKTVFDLNNSAINRKIDGLKGSIPKTTTGRNYLNPEWIAFNKTQIVGKEIYDENTQTYTFVQRNDKREWSTLWLGIYGRKYDVVAEAIPGETIWISFELFLERPAKIRFDYNNQKVIDQTQGNDHDDTTQRRSYLNGIQTTDNYSVFEIPAGWNKLAFSMKAKDHAIWQSGSCFGLESLGTGADQTCKLRKVYIAVGDILGDYVPYQAPVSEFSKNVIKHAENETRQLIQRVVTPMIPSRIGGTNLILDSNFVNIFENNTKNPWKAQANTSFVKDMPSTKQSNRLYITRWSENLPNRRHVAGSPIINWLHMYGTGLTSGHYHGLNQILELPEHNGELTISFRARRGSDQNSTLIVIAHYITGTGTSNTLQDATYYAPADITTSNTAVRYTYTFKNVPSNCTAIRLIFCFNNPSVVNIKITEPKLEIGSIASEWSPHPMDLATVNQVHEISDTVNSHTRTIKEQGEKISQVVQKADGIITTVEKINPGGNNLINDWTMRSSVSKSPTNVGGSATWSIEWRDDFSLPTKGFIRVRCTKESSDSVGFHLGFYQNIINQKQYWGKPMSFAVYARTNKSNITFSTLGMEPASLYKKNVVVGTSFQLIQNTGVTPITGGYVHSFVAYKDRGSWKLNDYIDFYGLTLKESSVYILPEPSSEYDINLSNILPRINNAWEYGDSTFDLRFIQRTNNELQNLRDVNVYGNDPNGYSGPIFTSTNTSSKQDSNIGYYKRYKTDWPNDIFVKGEFIDTPSDAPTKSKYTLKITSRGEVRPGYGGFWRTLKGEDVKVYKPGAEFVIKLIAKIPSGNRLFSTHNNLGTGSIGPVYLTDNLGTGKWEEYYIYYKLGVDHHPHNVLGYFTIYPTGSAVYDNIQWYVCYHNMYALQSSTSYGNNIRSIKTEVSQMAGSWAVKNLNSKNDIISQINLTDDNVKIKGSNISIDGNTHITNASIDFGKIKNVKITNAMIADSTIDNSKIKSLSVDKITGLNAEFIKAKMETAIVNLLVGKTIRASNGYMSIDLETGRTIYTGNSGIDFTTNENYLRYGTSNSTAFYRFTQRYGTNYPALAMGVNYSKNSSHKVWSIASNSYVPTMNPNNEAGQFSGIKIFSDENIGRMIELSTDTVSTSAIIYAKDIRIRKGNEYVSLSMVASKLGWYGYGNG